MSSYIVCASRCGSNWINWGKSLKLCAALDDYFTNGHVQLETQRAKNRNLNSLQTPNFLDGKRTWMEESASAAVAFKRRQNDLRATLTLTIFCFDLLTLPALAQTGTWNTQLGAIRWSSSRLT